MFQKLKDNSVNIVRLSKESYATVRASLKVSLIYHLTAYKINSKGSQNTVSSEIFA